MRCGGLSKAVLALTKPLLLLILVFMYIMLYFMVFDELLKETVRVSSCQNVLKYNKITQLGVPNGDRVRLIEVTELGSH